MNKLEEKIRLFGNKYYNNNKNNCIIFINGEKIDFFVFFENKNFVDNITIKIIMNENITNLSYMFSGCSSLSSISDISKWNTKNIIKMEWIFWM